MENRKIYLDVSALKTKDLLINKVELTKKIHLFQSVKIGSIGLIGLFVGNVAKAWSAQELYSAMSVASYFAVFYITALYLFFDRMEAEAVGKKELINDLHSIRLNRTGR
jgi:uncharacterized membrane protein YfcA